MFRKGRGQGHISTHHTIMFQRCQGPGALEKTRIPTALNHRAFRLQEGHPAHLSLGGLGQGSLISHSPGQGCPSLMQKESEFGLGRSWPTPWPSASRASQSGRQASLQMCTRALGPCHLSADSLPQADPEDSGQGPL